MGYLKSLPLCDPSAFVPTGPRPPTWRPMGTTFPSSTFWCIGRGWYSQKQLEDMSLYADKGLQGVEITGSEYKAAGPAVTNVPAAHLEM